MSGERRNVNENWEELEDSWLLNDCERLVSSGLQQAMCLVMFVGHNNQRKEIIRLCQSTSRPTSQG